MWDLMQGAMRAYEIALSQKSALGSQVSQDVRMAFHGLFGHTDLGTQREIFSSSCHAQEDAYEALQLLMSEYQKVTKTPTRRLYCPLETTRRYAPYGVQKNADIDRIPSPDGTCQSRLGAYSQLDSDNATRQCCLDYQIFLDMQSMSNLSFSEMFNRFFNNRHVNDYEDAEYLLPDRKVQKFKLAAEERKFLEIPQELSLTLKRFGSDMYGNSFKITTPVAVEKVLCLPASATPENKPIPYELTAFIVHSGGISGGHYICYKKVEGRWIEANDSRVRFVTEHEIDEILQGKKGEYFTSYMHHYSRSNSCESVTSAAEQRTQNALQQCIAQELREKLAMQTLEALPNFISSGSTCLESVPSHVLSTLHHAIWLNDKTPNINEYGTKELEKNPQKIHEIKLPWLIGREESSLVDQMRLIQKQKLEIASYRTHEAHLKNFLAKLDNPMLNCDELIKTFKALPKKQIRWKLQGLIYENHKKRFGEAHVHKREYNNDYGRYVLENGDVRKTIKEAFNDQQMNIVEQLASAFNLSAKLLEIEYEKQQLEGLASLLDPSKGLTTKQLVKAFERLEIRPETRKNILKSIWLGREKPSGDNNYGGNTFAREPRCLIEITKSIIEPPLAPAGSCILRQVIALLDEEANHFINPANNRMRSL